jgi:hypothetical protein
MGRTLPVNAPLDQMFRRKRSINHSRASTRRTCDSSHCPFLLTVGTPRILSARATPFNDVAPAVCKAVIMGATSAALSLACFLRAFKEATRAFAVRSPRGLGMRVIFPLISASHANTRRTWGRASRERRRRPASGQRHPPSYHRCRARGSRRVGGTHALTAAVGGYREASARLP